MTQPTTTDHLGRLPPLKLFFYMLAGEIPLQSATTVTSQATLRESAAAEGAPDRHPVAALIHAIAINVTAPQGDTTAGIGLQSLVTGTAGIIATVMTGEITGLLETEGRVAVTATSQEIATVLAETAEKTSGEASDAEAPSRTEAGRNGDARSLHLLTEGETNDHHQVRFSILIKLTLSHCEHSNL